jgi:sporulation protein YlmC with PRC-barrel domain
LKGAASIAFFERSKAIMERDMDDMRMASAPADTELDEVDVRNGDDWDDEDTHRYRRVMSAGTLAGDRVRNSAGEDLGKIEEIMIDVPSGRIAYAVLSFGGFLGIGDKLFAIPWRSLTLNEKDHEFILNVDRQRMENAPGFDKDNWPDMASPEFGNSVQNYWNAPQQGDSTFDRDRNRNL